MSPGLAAMASPSSPSYIAGQLREVEDAARRIALGLGCEIIDSFIGRMMANISSMARILDAQTVVTGMQPAVAITLVELGLSLPGIKTALNVERGMQLLQAALAADRVDGSDPDADSHD